MKFKDIVSVSEAFSRSVNIALDLNNQALIQNYVCPHSSATLLYSMVQQIQRGQCAFTWTGPYGAGKSSLALFLRTISNRKGALYTESIAKIPAYQREIQEFFEAKKYRIHSIVGALKNPLSAIAKKLETEATADAILKQLTKMATGTENHILMLDEMGKFLEYSARNTDASSDVYFYQQIAEIANRSQGRLVFIGILHQSIVEYARGLTKSLRDEWLKVQGRFIDLAVNAAGEEQLELISRAIKSSHKPKHATPSVLETVATIEKNRPIHNKPLLTSILTKTWPLHPVVASLLVPISQKRFSQNQRSLFSFLSSAEPYGFQHFLEREIPIPQQETLAELYYSPEEYWLYLTANLENAILSSDDANRWILAREALNRAEANEVSELAVTLLKWIILIDLFRGNSGLEATDNLFIAEFSSAQRVKKALGELLALNIIRKARRAGSYMLFNGSDFDLDAAKTKVEKEITELDYKTLNRIANFTPIIAKRNYHETGAMRFMNVALVPPKKIHNISAENFNESQFAALYLILPNDSEDAGRVSTLTQSFTSNTFPILLGIPQNAGVIREIAYELLLLDAVAKLPELAGDRIARAEVEHEQTRLNAELDNAFLTALRSLEVYLNGENLGVLSAQALSQLCSTLAEERFSKTPILHTELLNNDKPSGSANGGLNALLKRMATQKGEYRLGIEGFPAEGGLFKILLEDTGLYRQTDTGDWAFMPPKEENSQGLYPLWEETRHFLSEQKGEVSLQTLHQFWQSPPYGIKQGLLSFITLSFLLTQEGLIAAYIDETYLTEIDDLFVDYLTKNAKEIAFRYVPQDHSSTQIIKGICQAMKSAGVPGSYRFRETPLEISKSLVQMVYNLNEWVLRTRSLSKKSTRLREILKRARDPHKLIFDEIIPLFALNNETKTGANEGFVAFKEALKEMLFAYPKLLENFKATLLKELQLKELDLATMSLLQERAESVYQASGDFRIDALASRLTQYSGSDEEIAGILGLAANKPTRDWIDLDVERATIELATLCRGFKRAELFAHLKGKKSHRHSVALISSFAGEDSIREVSFEFLESDKTKITELKRELLKDIQSSLADESPEIALAALAQLSEHYMQILTDKENES